MKKFFTFLVLSCSCAMLSGCMSLGRDAQKIEGVVYDPCNDALRELNADMFNCCAAVEKTIGGLGVDFKKRATHPKESIYKFEYQNISYKLTLDYTDPQHTLLTVKATSNLLFRNRRLAGQLAMKIDSNL